MARILPDANVTIKMKGLGLAHHNIGKGVWEFIFMRGIPEHDLKVIVREYRRTAPKPVTILNYQIPDDDKKIKIETVNAVSPNKPSHGSGVHNFNWRHQIDDNHDARWMIDLSKELHKSPVKLRNKKNIGLTLLTISESVLYADNLIGTIAPYRITKNDEPFKDRAVGQWLGMDIQWSEDTPQTNIVFENYPSKSLKPDGDVYIYEIEINNDCCEGQPATETDFKLYYEYLVDMPDTFDELLPTQYSKVFSKLEMLKGRDDCHLNQVTDLAEISSLEDLL